MSTLYLFTNHFPYSFQENFLEDEIVYHSKLFDKIVILSFENNDGAMRSVPKNCEVRRVPISKRRIGYIIKGIFHPRTIGLIIREFFRGRVYRSKKRLFSWGSSARYLNNCLYNNEVKNAIREMRHEDVCYFYWGIGQCLLSIILKNKVHLVSRFHGAWDLWEEDYGDFHALRTDVAKSLDKAVFIAHKGEEYFRQRYPFAHTITIPLGSIDQGLQLPSPNDGILRVVSCSTVYPLKRVSLIFEVLNSMTDYRIEWTHLGGGSHFIELKEKVDSEKREHLTVVLTGMMSHDKIMSFYKTHHFDLFINLSTNEGVPVSIMEAMSFGIPIVATDVGCTSEEVVPEVGILVSSNPSVVEVAKAVRTIGVSSYNPRAFWESHYNADVNYSSFATMIINL